MEVDYYPPGHKLHLMPNFEKEALEDNTPLEEVMERVIRARKKSNILSQAEKQTMIEKTKHWIGINDVHEYTVGMLRKQDRDSWNELRIPIMAREFLRNLIIQAQDLNYRQILECQFNRGLPLDWDAYNQKAEAIAAMGFSRKDAVEALVIKGDPQLAVELLLLQSADKEQAARDWEYEKNKEIKAKNRSVAYNSHHSVVKARQERAEQKKLLLKESKTVLRRKIGEIEQELKTLKVKRKENEEEMTKKEHGVKMDRAAAFLKGLVDSGEINPAEMQKANRKMQIFTDTENLALLEQIGTTQDAFENMKNFDDQTGAGPGDEAECDICFEPGREYMFLPCGHVSICKACADDVNYDKSICFNCRKPATGVIQIKFD